jgi:enamine deaminase RidA (YjgF/YER057c/UK114 family)
VNVPGLPEFPAVAHATIAGDFIYVSGMIGLDESFTAVIDGGIGPETTRALRLIERISAMT